MKTFSRLVVALVAAVGILVGFAGAASADLVDTHPCPEGYTGVVVEVNGNYAQACQNIYP